MINTSRNAYLMSHLKNWPESLTFTSTYMWAMPGSEYIQFIVQGQQIDVLVRIGHTHIVSSKHKILNKLPRSTQKHNCGNGIYTTITLQFSKQLIDSQTMYLNVSETIRKAPLAEAQAALEKQKYVL